MGNFAAKTMGFLYFVFSPSELKASFAKGVIHRLVTQVGTLQRLSLDCSGTFCDSLEARLCFPEQGFGAAEVCLVSSPCFLRLAQFRPGLADLPAAYHSSPSVSPSGRREGAALPLPADAAGRQEHRPVCC